ETAIHRLPAYPYILHDVLGFAGAAEHPVRDAEKTRARPEERLEAVVSGKFDGHRLSPCARGRSRRGGRATPVPGKKAAESKTSAPDGTMRSRGAMSFQGHGDATRVVTSRRDAWSYGNGG